MIEYGSDAAAIRKAVEGATADLAAEVERLKQIETLNCMSIEEGCEIINEMSAALAAMVDEDLTECSASHCLGHFGEKTSEAFNVALESRRADRARIARLEGALRGYECTCESEASYAGYIAKTYVCPRCDALEPGS